MPVAIFAKACWPGDLQWLKAGLDSNGELQGGSYAVARPCPWSDVIICYITAMTHSYQTNHYDLAEQHVSDEACRGERYQISAVG